MRCLSRNDIEAIANRVLRAYKKLPEMEDKDIYRIEPELLLKRLLGLSIDYSSLSREGSVLGLTAYGEVGVQIIDGESNNAFYFLDGKTVLIDKQLKDDPAQVGRRNFTMMHEGGHHILRLLFKKDYCDEISKARIRYACYNKSRRRMECDGQSGYTAHILDDAVTKVLHQVFDKLNTSSEAALVGIAHERSAAKLKAEIVRIKTENAKANTEYESLKAEIIKAVQGKSSMPQDVLSELISETRTRVLDTSQHLSQLMLEQEQNQQEVDDMKDELERIRSWSEIFDESDIEVKKMIASYVINRVDVYKGYELKITLNLSVQQFLNGIEQPKNSAENDEANGAA